MTLYEKLCASSLDITDLGFIPCQRDGVLGTTPDGKIAFTSDHEILANGKPIAKDFADFLGLLCCADSDLLAKAPRWTRLRFQREVDRRNISWKQQMVRNALKNCFHPPAIHDPYGYIRSLQRIPTASHASLGASVQFGKSLWHAKEVEIRNDSLEIQVYVEIPGQVVLDFYDPWEGITPDEEQTLRMEAEDPFALHLDITAMINGTEFAPEIVENIRWDPLADNSPDAEDVLHRFGLDMEQGWLFLRLQLPYTRKKKNRIRSLSLYLEPKTVTIPGPRLLTPMAQDSVPILHPVTGKNHNFSVYSYEIEGLDPNFLTNPPCFYTRLCYDLTPALGEDVFRIFDSVPNDRLIPPIGTVAPVSDPDLENVPTAKLAELDENLPAHIRTVFSSRHYKETHRVEWLTQFRCTLASPAVLPIIR